MPTPRLPSADELPNLPLRTDEALLERVRALVQPALRRQLWFLLLDERDCQLPVLLPMDIPARPAPGETGGIADFAEALAEFLDAVAAAGAAASLVIVYERPGPAELRTADGVWFRFLGEVEALARTPIRALAFVAGRQVRLIPRELRSASSAEAAS